MDFYCAEKFVERAKPIKPLRKPSYQPVPLLRLHSHNDANLAQQKF